jgi:hypothetical protein
MVIRTSLNNEELVGAVSITNHILIRVTGAKPFFFSYSFVIFFAMFHD